MYVNFISSPLKASVGYSFDLRTAIAEVEASGFSDIGFLACLEQPRIDGVKNQFVGAGSGGGEMTP